MKHGNPGRAGRDRILLGLAISALSLRPGECRTDQEIAYFCGCSRQNIEHLEKRALLKCRKALGKEWRAG